MANTIAPETFAVAPLVPPTTTPDTGFRAVSAGVEGVRLAQAPRAAGIDFSPASDRSTLNSLMSLGVAALKTKVEQERMRQMGEGAIAAIQGQTAKELAEGDALMGVFGDPVAVAAARQVEKVTQLDRAMQEVQDGMEQWRTKSPEAFRKELPELMKRHLTGDPLSDSLISRAFVEKVPALTDLHTRAHISYVNQRAQDAFFDSAVASGESLKKYLAEERNGRMGHTTDIQATFLRDVASSLSMLKPENAEKASMAILQHYTTSGNHEALELLSTAGISKAFSKEAQAKLPLMLEQARHTDWVNNPRYLKQYENLGAFEATVREGLTDVASIEKMYADNSGPNGGLKQEWVKQQVEQLAIAKARNARRATEGAGITKEMMQRALFSQITTQGGDLQTHIPGLTPENKRVLINEDYARNPKSLDLVVARNGWLPTPVEAQARAAINHALVGQFHPATNGQMGDIETLRELSRLNTINPHTVQRSLGEDTYLNFLTMIDAGALRDKGDEQKNQQQFMGISTAIRAAQAQRKDVDWQRGREKEANSALSSISPVGNPIRAFGTWAYSVWRGEPQPNADQQKQLADMRAVRLRKLAQNTTLPMDKLVTLVDESMSAEVGLLAGAPIMGEIGQEKPFKANVVNSVLGKGGSAFNGRLIDDVEINKAQVRALESKLQIPARKTTKKETDYSVTSAIYDGNRINVLVQFADGTTNDLYLTPEDVAHEYVERNKTEFQRTYNLSK